VVRKGREKAYQTFWVVSLKVAKTEAGMRKDPFFPIPIKRTSILVLKGMSNNVLTYTQRCLLVRYAKYFGGDFELLKFTVPRFRSSSLDLFAVQSQHRNPMI